MDLVDEQDLVRLQVGQQRREITGPLQDRPGGLLESRPQLVRNHVRQRRLAEPGRPEDQHVIERVAALPRGRNENLHLRLDGALPDVIGERLWPHGAVV